MNIFKNLRKTASGANENGSLLKYAFIEVFLVVIGILIAVSINNWNEDRKAEKELDNILGIVKKDLENDLIQIADVKAYHELFRPIFRKILADSLTRQDYIDNPNNLYILAGYPEFSINQRGYQLLNNFRSNSELSQDTLSARIVEFYTERLLEIKVDDDFRSEDFKQNYMHWKQNYEWWADYINMKDTEGFIEYSLNDPDYKNRVATVRFLTYFVYLPELDIFQEQAEQIIGYIDDRLN